MFVCLLVCGGLMEFQTPAPILMKFCTHFLPVQGVFWSGGPKILKAEGDIFENSL